MSDHSIGFISGTGPQGRGLAMRFALAGVPVRIGSRDEERARVTAEELNAIIAVRDVAVQDADGQSTRIEGGGNHRIVAASEFVMLTVPFEHAQATLETYRDDFREGSVFVDVTVPLAFGKGDVQVLVPPEGSGSSALRKVLPGHIPFTGAFKTLPAHVMEALETRMDCDTFLFGDDKAAKGKLAEIIRRIPGLRPIDVGGMSAAATLEGMTALLIRINRRLKSKSARYSVVGAS